MALDRPLTLEDLKQYTATPAQKTGGYRCYAKRVLMEAEAFAKQGDNLNAELRFAKVKQYCLKVGIEYPPLSTIDTCLYPASDWTTHPLHSKLPELKAQFVPPEPPPKVKVPKVKPPKRTKAQLKEMGHQNYAMAMLSTGGTLQAACYYLDFRKVPYPPKILELLSGVGHGAKGDPSTGGLDIFPPHETDTPELRPTVQPEVPTKVEPPVAQKVEVPIEKLSLQEQLERQLAELDAAERVAATPPVPEPDSVHHKIVVSDQMWDDVKEYSDAMPNVAVTPPAQPEPVKVEAKAVSEAPTEPTGLRKAKVHNFCVNPRLANIKFLDGAQEFASMWIHRTGLRFNDVVSVEIERGTPGLNAIYQEKLPKK